MGNSLRCFVACVLPCGALDVIRIVHLSGDVEEYSRPVFAKEILATNPGHVLSKPCSSHAGMPGRIVVVISPESELKRGSFYSLIPSSSLPNINNMKKKQKQKQNENECESKKSKVLVQDKYLEDILSEKKSGFRRKSSSGRVGVWRPHLESILEDPNN